MCEINRLELWNVYLAAKSKSNHIYILIDYVKDKIDGQSLETDENWINQVKRILRNFVDKCNKSYKSPIISYKNSLFLQKNSAWLSRPEIFPRPGPQPEPLPGPSTSKGGRPESAFKDLKEGSKRKRTQTLREKKELEEIAHATHMKLREEGKSKAAKLLKRVMEASPRSVNMIFIAVDKIRRTQSGNLDDGSPKEFSLEEAVVHQIECDFTKAQYILNRQRLIDKNCKVFPTYEKISGYKLQCIPSNIHVTERKAYVSLQDMLNHTASRIVTAQEEVFKSESIVGRKVELVSKIGFDGSSNHSRYNQIWKDFQADDNNMVLTAIVPLILHQKENEAEKVNVLWMNRKPSSTVYCRPLELEFTKETTDYIKLKAEELKNASGNLENTSVKVNGTIFEVSHRVVITMIDGKVSSAMTATGSATCNVCKATPSQMNDIDAVLRRDCDKSALDIGLSVLHLNIRFLEYFLNIAKRKNNVEQCYGKYTKEQLAKIDAKRKVICGRLEKELGLVLDKPTSKGGNTNTGNNARRFFDYAVKVAEITGLDLNMLQKCRIVLKTLSCGYAIDTAAFHEFCVQFARELVDEKMYKFWFMPAAVHLALIHGAAMIKALPVPIGMLSEEPLESSHKIVRYFRLHHTRKTSRKDTMTDLFRGLQIHTDPVIASLRRPPKPKGAIDRGVCAMLLAASEMGGFSSLDLDYLIDEDDSDVDDPDLV